MAQNNSNVSHVLDNTISVINGTGGWSTGFVSASGAAINTVLNSGNVGNLDDTLNPVNYNDNYSIAQTLEDKTLNTATVLANNIAKVNFLPTEQVAKPEWVAATKGGYLDATTWTAKPTLTGTASAFTLNNTNDGNKTVVVSENISGSPFTTGNGALNEVLTFRGTANDVLTVKHNVTVSNVPATTNKNAGSALDVRGEAYSESYAKQGVTSNYAWNTNHKYTESNSNQTLNDAFAQSYGYKDADLTINSTVKTNLADSANINGSERIVENKAANYSYSHVKTGSVNYVVTDTRDLAQADQRTWTNTTVTNVAKFEVVDNTNDGKTTITAKGLITGTTDNLSTAKSAATPTTFKATGAEFKVVSDHYTLTVDPKEFDVDHAGVASNALLTLVDATAVPTGDVFNSALGDVRNASISPKNVADKVTAMADAFNPYVSNLVGANASGNVTLDGTQFKDVITVKDTDKTPFNAQINAGLGNDTITGGFGADVINGDAGADVINGGAGNDDIKGDAGADVIDGGAGDDTINGGAGDDQINVTSGKDTIVAYQAAEPEVKEVKDAAGKVTTPAKAEIVHDVVNIKPGATANFADTNNENKFYVVSNAATAKDDVVIKTAADYTDKVVKTANILFDYSKETTDKVVNATDVSDTILTGVSGKYNVSGFTLGSDALTVAKGTATAKVTLADGTTYNVAADTVIQATVKTIADLTKLAGVTPDKLNLVGTDKDDVLVGGTSDDTLNGGKGADKLTGGAGADKFIFTDLTNGVANRVDTITDFSKTAGDKIDVSALGFKTFVDGAFTAANSANALRFDAATQTLQGNTGDLTKIELEIKVIGDAPTATDFIFA